MTQFIISALGSYGDVHPMVGLGEALHLRGHDVKIVTNPYFEDVVASAGLALLPIGTREDYVELSKHPHLWHPIRGPKLVLETAVSGLRPLYDIVSTNYVPGETVFCAHVLDLASRTASESLGAPLAAVHFAPGVFWSVYDSPRLKGAVLGPTVPQWLKRFQFWASDVLFVNPLFRPLNELRRDLGLPPVKRVFSFWLNEADVILGLFPEWFGPPQPDWPKNVRLVGFPLWDAPGSVPNFQEQCSEHGARERKMGTDPSFGLSDDVRAFLAAGAPPIAFSPGSANKEAHPFFSAAVAACERLGRRGILLTKYDDQLPSQLPASVRHFGFVPLSKLLPHTAALVHHGGIGSCAQALAAGVPHLVRPMSFDQFDNARRLVELGVAEELSVRRFRGATVAESLQRLLESPPIAEKCQDLAARCDGRSSLEAACDVLEELSVVRGPLRVTSRHSSTVLS